ncbi:MAG: sulfotransferase [Pirellulaceae bacterium]|nr:sulfotransferase [Pirellulaceae bacterium]
MDRLPLQIPFKRSFVLNSLGDDERWNAFLNRNGWSDDPKRLVRVPTLDPRKVLPPHRWRGTASQWAKLRGLQSVFEYCLNHSIPCAMLLTDDATLVPESQTIIEGFASELPIDWKLLLFAGKHEHLSDGVPVAISLNVSRPYSVSSSCAFAWRGFPMLRRLYDFTIQSCANRTGARDFTARRRTSARGFYVPNRWMFQSEELDKFDDAAKFSEPISQTVVAVLGCFRGGTSCVAGVLHHLGVSMGDRFLKTDMINPRGYFECLVLHRLCKRSFDYPSMARKRPARQIAGLLRHWTRQRVRSLSESTLIGAKHPSLCCLGPEMVNAWSNCKFIVVDREPEVIIASILKTTWGWSREEAKFNTLTMLAQREKFLKSCSLQQFLRVDFELLRIDTRNQVQRIAEWLGLPTDDEGFASAVAHVAS